MAPEELLAALRERPFQPFRLALTDGQTIEVRHPELVMTSRRSAVIGIPAPAEPEAFYHHRITVNLLHIVSLEPLPRTTPTNGQS
jgi:hypothetical protein